MADSRSRSPDDAPAVEAGPADARFDALADRNRRRALAAVYRRDAPVSVRELARVVLGTDGLGADPVHVRRVRIALYHVHAPKLDAAGLARFDADRRELAPPEDGVDPDVASLLPSA